MFLRVSDKSDDEVSGDYSSTPLCHTSYTDDCPWKERTA